MRLFTAIALLCVSTAASAVPVQLTTVLWTFRPDHAIAANLQTGEGLDMGDCMTCFNDDYYLLDYRRATAYGEVISRTETTMQTTHTNAHNFMEYNAYATLDVIAQVPRGSGGGSFARVALTNFTLGFQVLERVLYMGTSGLSPGEAPIDFFGGVDPLPISSGTVLDPGFYFTSLGYDYIGTDGYLTNGRLVAHEELYFDYRFTSVPAPPTLLMVGSLLLGIGAVKKRRVAQRNSAASA